MNLVKVKISDLKPHPMNYNTHPEAQIKELMKSLQMFGQFKNIVIRQGLLICGHGLVEAAKKIGWTELYAEIRDDLSDDEAKSMMIADNALPFGGVPNSDDLDKLLKSIPFGDIPGVTEDWLKEMKVSFLDDQARDAEPQIDKAAELNKKWQVNIGDLWQIGEHKLLCGNCTIKEDFERLMDSEKAICCFTDPPYGVSIGDKNIMLNTFQKAGRCLNNLDMDTMKPDELKSMLLKSFVLARETAMADNCSVFVCSPQGGELGMMMMMMMMEAHLTVRHVINWVKNSPTFSVGRLDYDYQHEPILFTWVKTHKRNRNGMFQTSIWKVDKPRSNKEHPTIKPIELPSNAILNHTDPEDIVLDMFIGSGTTMVACENLKRKCRGMEISPDYCAVILERMKEAFPGIEIIRTESSEKSK